MLRASPKTEVRFFRELNVKEKEGKVYIEQVFNYVTPIPMRVVDKKDDVEMQIFKPALRK